MVFAKKKWGQNFLVDNNLLEKIIKTIDIKKDDEILEIGPGHGALSEKIVQKTKILKMVEIDPELIKVIGQNPLLSQFEIFNQDILKTNLKELGLNSPKVIGNIPYNITSPIIFWLIDHLPYWSESYLMVQKEVAQRIVADQESDDYGALSVLFGLFTESKIQFDVSKNCFYPPPKITSSVITIQRESLVDQEVRLDAFEISKVAFQQRRKKVRTSLSSIISEGQLEELDIDINSRAGNLSPDDYLKIAKARQ